MLEAFPFVPLASSVRIGVAIFSYNGMLNYGVTGDYDTAPDIGVLCDGIEAGMTELVKLAAPARATARPGGPPGGEAKGRSKSAGQSAEEAEPGPDHRAERRVTRHTLPLSIVALVLAGCGGGNGDRATQTQAPATPAERSAVAELKYCFEGAGALTAKPGRPIPEVGQSRCRAGGKGREARARDRLAGHETRRKRLLRDERRCGRERGGQARRKPIGQKEES